MRMVYKKHNQKTIYNVSGCRAAMTLKCTPLSSNQWFQICCLGSRHICFYPEKISTVLFLVILAQVQSASFIRILNLTLTTHQSVILFPEAQIIIKTPYVVISGRPGIVFGYKILNNEPDSLQCLSHFLISKRVH